MRSEADLFRNLASYPQRTGTGRRFVLIIDAGIHSRAWKDLAAMHAALEKAFDAVEEDPSLRHAIEHWPRAD